VLDKGVEFDETPLVEELVDPLPRRQLALFVLLRDGLFTAPRLGFLTEPDQGLAKLTDRPLRHLFSSLLLIPVIDRCPIQDVR